MRRFYFILVVVSGAVVLSWVLSCVVRLGTTSGGRYPFVYYSSLLQDFLVREGGAGGVYTHVDRRGNVYSREAFDSLTPLFSYRQLAVSGGLPDSVLGVRVDAQLLRSKAFTWRYNPRMVDSPGMGLYFMYETESGRASLESPGDVFRLGSDVEFVDKFRNGVDVEKGVLFRSALEGAGFVFPARRVWGNLSAKRAYDVGYFVLDGNGGLFHLRMVGGLPVVCDTRVGDSLEVAFFSVLEVADRSIYGFLVSCDGGVYSVGTGGDYGLCRMDIPAIDVGRHSVLLMGNLFYRIVEVSSGDSLCCYVLDGDGFGLHDGPLVIVAGADVWDVVSDWVFPVYVSFSGRSSEYLRMVFHVSSGWGFVVSGLLAVVFLFLIWRCGRRGSFLWGGVCVVVVVVFGVAGFISCLLFRE